MTASLLNITCASLASTTDIDAVTGPLRAGRLRERSRYRAPVTDVTDVVVEPQ